MEKNYILAEPLREILRGNEVEVLKTLKANGENVQVSWSTEAQCWVICSKNVALIAEDKSDISYYKSDRYAFAREMAHVWFDKLDELKKKGFKIEELKKDLQDMTLIGEYVGSQDH